MEEVAATQMATRNSRHGNVPTSTDDTEVPAPLAKELVAELTTRAAAASKAGASEDDYFDNINHALRALIGEAVDFLCKSRAADPAWALASWLTTLSISDSDAAAAAPPTPPSGDAKRLKARLRELEAANRLLETDNDTLNQVIEDYERDLAGMRKELREMSAAKATGCPSAGDDVVAFSDSDAGEHS